MTDTVRIPLYGRGGSVRGHVLVDAADYAALAAHRWCLNAGYAGRRVDGQLVRMHRELLGLTPGDGIEVDHINRDKLDNRRANLRAGTHALNAQNMPAIGGASPYRGVTYCQRTQRWRAQAKLNGRRHHLGRFDTQEQAAAAAAAFRRDHMPYAAEAA